MFRSSRSILALAAMSLAASAAFAADRSPSSA